MRVDGFKVVKVHLFSIFQLNAFEELEVDQLEIFECDKRRLLQIKNLLTRLIDQALGETHHRSAHYFGSLCSYQILTTSKNVEQEYTMLVKTLKQLIILQR